MNKLSALPGLIFTMFLNAFTALFGEINWQAPQWLIAVNNLRSGCYRWILNNPKASLLSLLVTAILVASSWFAYDWWQSRPKPVTIDFSVQAPVRADLEKKAPPNPLVIRFNASVAPIALVGKEVTNSIALNPEIAGKWHWKTDKVLEFKPEKEWPVGQKFVVKFKKGAVAEQIKLAREDFDFNAPAFTSTLVKSEFYQNPLDPLLKKAVIQLRFSYPVDSKSLEENIHLSIRNKAEAVQKGKNLPFTVSYDSLKLNAFVHSESLPVPAYDQLVDFRLADIVKAEGSNATNAFPLTASVVVPGLYNGLDINDVQITITPNKQNLQQEQILLVNTTLPVNEQLMAENVAVWLLPKKHPEHSDSNDSASYPWSPEEVTADIIKSSSRVLLNPVPAEHEFSEIHGFRFQAEVGRQLYVSITKNIKSFGGYQLPKAVYRTLTVPEYPKELHILGEGSLLTLSGEKKIALMGRDVAGVKVELGRVLPEQLQNLISQSDGDFAHPVFSGVFGQDNLSERFVSATPFQQQTPGIPSYQSVDLSKYMIEADGREKRGIFLVTAKNYDPADPDKYIENEVVDKRLILVTDLGIIAKTQHDGSQVVFVQSIQSGKPQAQVEVEILGKNGLVLFSGKTDDNGQVRFPKLSGLERERQPVCYLVKFQGDMSFLPIDRADRRLNFSRFGIEGETNAKDANQLNAYLFSDRGIYRPGDSFHIGIIVKADNWSLPLAGIPLQAEITDARGLVVKQEKIKVGAGGFNELSYDTLESSPTGNYTTTLYTVKDGHSDQYLGQTKVKVEEFQPDRMKTTASFSRPLTEGWLNPDDLKVTVNVQNLYGAPAEARLVEANITLKPVLPFFKNFKDYSFFDPHYAKEGFDEPLTAGQTDSKGNAVFDLGLDKYAKATYQLHFYARAFEAKGGRSVNTEIQTLVSDLPYLVGYKADGKLNFVTRDSKRQVAIIAINPEVKPITADQLSLELVERKMLSVLTRQVDNTYKYESRLKEISIHKDPLQIPEKGYDLLLDSSKPGDYSYIIRNNEGLLLSRIDYSVAGNGNVSRTLDRNAELQLTLDKSEYEPGEKISVNIRAPYTGAGLITIERDKVYNSVWFKTDTQSTVQSIEVPKELVGNAYVTVQYIRDPGSDEIFMSPLSYGVAPFKISLASHTLGLKLSVPELIKPGQNLVMKLDSPEPARVVVFAVDEGILQVAHYQNPDPLGHFFKKRQLEVDTSQILDLILPEFKKLMQLAAPGGDSHEDEAAFLNPFKRKHDKPAVYWSGIVDINGAKEFSYQVPDTFNGTMRVMAVAVNQERIASVSEKTLVRGDLIITPNAPYVVSPGDEFTVSVAVANNVKGTGDKANVEIALTVPPQLQIKDAAKKTLAISEGHEGVVTFTIAAITGKELVLGNATLNFSAEVGGQKTTLPSQMSIRPATPRISDMRFGSFKGTQEVSIDRVLYPQRRQVSAGISPLPLVSISGLTAYLENFEHSCTEQLFSKAVPMLVLSKHPEFTEDQTVKVTDADFARLFSVLRTRQNAEGGFGLWTASAESNPFVSVYVVNLLMEAQALGIAIPEDMLQKGTGYIQNLANSPASDINAVRIRAYAAYLLTQKGIVTSTILSTLRENLKTNFKEQQWRNDLVAVYLAGSYQLLQQQAQADDLIATPIKNLSIKQKDFNFELFYDPLIYDAQTLYILAKQFPKKLQALPPSIFQNIVQGIVDRHYNTLSSAYLLMAFSAYVDVVPQESVTNMAIAAIDQTGKQNSLELPHNFAPRVSFPENTKKLLFSGASDLPLYYAVTESGYDLNTPVTELKNGLEIMRSYTNAKGETIDRVTLGDEITVVIRVRAIDHDWLNDVVIQDLLPAGFEAVIQPMATKPKQQEETDNNDASENESSEQDADNSNGDSTDTNAFWHDRLTTGGNWTPQYVDIREDRVVLYGTVQNQLGEYRYKLKATNNGIFNVPPIFAEAMYQPTIRARSGAGKISVIDAPQKPSK